ncbi:uncharacterized protein H6S33_013009 [Morchella sextelata]|uniref:uncharacterized protein n=1 Tax=Morchella sextelata TaxID=1174677 RepID=UPI001D0523FA|nr:uncharacterized protein H6S33_013009 [Morchella sextelata]KAH0609523.1 hypothetical protein H6S33_013009 [Morchella sextelata]
MSTIGGGGGGGAFRSNQRPGNQGRSGTPSFPSNPSTTPAPASPAAAAPQSELSGMTDSRKRQSKRDEAIRRKIENDLNKKKHTGAPRSRQTRKIAPGTVMALRPSQALQIKPNTTVAEAAQIMAAKREDCVLVTDEEDRIAGIFTAKDLAFRVVGQGIDARDVTIASIMTKNPLCARTDTSATDALDLMVRKGFRHLPVMDENADISGILDITKCFYEAMEKLERAYASSRKLYDALEGVQSELGSSQPQQIIHYVEALRQKMSGPNLESVLDGNPPTVVNVRTTVREAAALMREHHTTAVLVQDNGNITGIFTSKDVVLRVIAAGLDPGNCSVVRVMTPHPDFAPLDMSIQAALRKMHDGHYLNLPVMNDSGEIVGMVDVLKLTYATLEQINSMGTGDSEGPAWNKFWLSLDNDSESVVSDSTRHTASRNNIGGPSSPVTGHRHGASSMERGLSMERAESSVLFPTDSASHHGGDSPGGSQMMPLGSNPLDTPFPFKFKAPSGRIHRVQVAPSGGLGELLGAVVEKLGHEVIQVGGEPTFGPDGKLEEQGFAMSYVDSEGDVVSITSDRDLVDAVDMARQGGRDKVDLYVHDPDKPAVPATVEPRPESVAHATPPRKRKGGRRRHDDSEEDSDDEGNVPISRRSHQPAPQPLKPELIPGVPNDLILPGAIVTLAVAIVAVFAMSRK